MSKTEEKKLENELKDPTVVNAATIDDYNAERKIAVDLQTEDNSTSEALKDFDDSDYSKEIIKEDKQFRKDLESGDVSTAGLSANQLTEVNRPLVPAGLGGKPVYETQSQYLAAEALKGKLSTSGQ